MYFGLQKSVFAFLKSHEKAHVSLESLKTV